VTVEYEARVEAIHITTSGGTVRTGTSREWSADAVVIATGAPAARALLSAAIGDSHALVAWLATVPTRPTWTVMLALGRELQADTFGVLANPAEARLVSACALPSGRWRPQAQAEGIVLAWPTPNGVERLGAQTATESVAAIRPEIERLVPETRGAVTHARVFRFDEGTPLTPPGFLAHRAAGRELAATLTVPIALAGDYLMMPLVEGAVASGELAAARIVRQLARA
jgi:predicted NAD/FAD-dependent oxidoreductase